MTSLVRRCTHALLGGLVLCACTPTSSDRNDGDGTGTGTDGTDDATSGSPTSGSPTTDPTGSVDDTSATSGGTDTGDPDVVLEELEVVPGNGILEVDLNTTASQAFMVTGHYSDGSSADLTGDAAWSHSNAMLGTFNGATLEIPAFATTFVDSTIVTAEVDGLSGDGQLTVAAYQQTGPQPDFFFVLPFEDGMGPQDKPLTFSTDVKSMDVFVSMDTTGSMGGPIANLQSSLGGTVIPGIQAAVPDTQFGVGAFEDFPISPFGSNPCFITGQPDQPFELLQEITASAMAAQAGVQALTVGASPIGCGADYPESSIESLYQIATGDGLAGPAPTFVAANATGVGGVAFRDGSMPVIVSITDAVSHDPGLPLCSGGTDYDANPSVLAVAHTRAQTKTALGDICAKVVTIAVNDFDTCSPYSDGLDFAVDTGAVIPPEAWDLAPGGRPPGCAAGQCCTGLNGAGVPVAPTGGCPLVYRSDFSGTGVGAGMVDGVSLLAAYAAFDVTTQVQGEPADVDGVPLPAPATTADFIDAVTPQSHGPVPLPGVPDPTLTPTTFENVIPDTDVTFSIVAFNDVVPQTRAPQVFTATIRVLADGCTDLDERTVLILVPPADLRAPV